MKFLLFAAIFVLYNHSIDAVVFERCALARELVRLGVPSGDIANWICIARGESTFNTQAVNRVNTDGSWDWGLFQINDRFWCNPGDGRPSSNGCGISCNQLLTDDITVAVRCSRQIQGSQGFTAWVAFNRDCSNGRAGSVADCGV